MSSSLYGVRRHLPGSGMSSPERSRPESTTEGVVDAVARSRRAQRVWANLGFPLFPYEAVSASAIIAQLRNE